MKPWQKTTFSIGLALIVLGSTSIYLTYLQSKEEKIDIYKIACNREEPYPNDPKLQLALDRVVRNLSWKIPELEKIQNCIEVSFTDGEQIEGLDAGFIHDEEKDPEKLIIIIAERYTDEEEALIGSLIAHEMTHAISRVKRYLSLKTMTEEGCYLEEAEAFHNQILFFNDLSEEELVRFQERTVDEGDPIMQSFVSFLTFFVNSKAVEQDDPVEYIRQFYVIANPQYREQCGKYSPGA